MNRYQLGREHEAGRYELDLASSTIEKLEGRIPLRSSSAWRPTPLSPPRLAIVRALDALRALLAALTDGDQLRFDLAHALDRQANCIEVE